MDPINPWLGLIIIVSVCLTVGIFLGWAIFRRKYFQRGFDHGMKQATDENIFINGQKSGIARERARWEKWYSELQG